MSVKKRPIKNGQKIMCTKNLFNPLAIIKSISDIFKGLRNKYTSRRSRCSMIVNNKCPPLPLVLLNHLLFAYRKITIYLPFSSGFLLDGTKNSARPIGQKHNQLIFVSTKTFLSWVPYLQFLGNYGGRAGQSIIQALQCTVQHLMY